MYKFIPSGCQVYQQNRENLTTSAVHTAKEAEVFSIKIDLNSKSAIITATYRPPNRVDNDYTLYIFSNR